MVARPECEAEFVEALAASNSLWHATDPEWDIVVPEGGTTLDLNGFTGLTYYSPEDLVVTVRSGTRISELQSSLSEHSQCLPLGGIPLGTPNPTLAQAVGFALPHTAEGRAKSWREWVLGMTVMLGDGTIAKSGSKVVKSVAGYDAHKLFIGSRGALGVILDVTLRAFPGSPPEGSVPARTDSGRPWIQRVLLTDFERAASAAGGNLVCSDPETSTLWAESDEPLTRFPEDWAIRGGPGDMEWRTDEVPLLLRAKSLLDPDGRLNPGALGIC